MIVFLVNLAPNLNPKTYQKSTQEAPKIDKKGIEFGPLLGRFWWITESSFQLIEVAVIDFQSN